LTVRNINKVKRTSSIIYQDTVHHMDAAIHRSGLERRPGTGPDALCYSTLRTVCRGKQPKASRRRRARLARLVGAFAEEKDREEVEGRWRERLWRYPRPRRFRFESLCKLRCLQVYASPGGRSLTLKSVSYGDGDAHTRIPAGGSGRRIETAVQYPGPPTNVMV
jgi:hypothetical protein